VGFLVSLRHRSTLKEKVMVKVGKRKEGDGELRRFWSILNTGAVSSTRKK